MSLILMGTLSSQDEAFNPIPTHEFGVNATHLVSNLIPFEGVAAIEPTASLIFFKRGNGRLYWRNGLNVDANKLETEFDETKNHLLMLKTGFEIKNSIAKSWTIHYGSEILGFWQGSSTKSTDPFFGEFENKQRTNSYGLNFMYGIQWLINERIALSSEGSFFAAITMDTSETDSGPGFPVNTIKTNGYGIDFVVPNSIYFSYYF
ncbi:MAG: hypothetical protein AAF487_10930 [Bacteroidota bacterium]